MAVRRGAAPPGKPARRLLQPGWLPKSPEIRRPGPRAAPGSRPGERQVPALRPDPSQHLYQCSHATYGIVELKAACERILQWANFRCGRLHGVRSEEQTSEFQS